MDIQEIRKQRRARRDQLGHVYFITDGEAIKIGFSTYPLGRLDTLQSAHPKPLKIVATFMGSLWDEHELHAHFRHLRVRGEWFKEHQEIHDFIAVMEAQRGYIEKRVITVNDIIIGRHLAKIAAHEFPGQCLRLARYIERSIHEILPEQRDVAWRARNAALTVDQPAFRQSKLVRDMTLADIAAFAT